MATISDEEDDSPTTTKPFENSGDGKLKTPQKEESTIVAGTDDDNSSLLKTIDQRRYRETVIIAIIGLFSIVFSIFNTVDVIRNWNSSQDESLKTRLLRVARLLIIAYPGFNLLVMFSRDAYKIKRDVYHLVHLALTNREDLLSILINFAHTLNGRFITTVAFAFAIKIVTGVALGPLIAAGIAISLVSVVIFMVVISRFGFFRALFNGNVFAVSACSLLIGICMGRRSVIC